MSLSISNSKFRHTRRVCVGVIIFAAVFVMAYRTGDRLSRGRLIASYTELARQYPGFDFNDKYVGYGLGVETLNHELYFYGTGAAMRHARAADVLILGSSRAAMGFSEGELEAYARQHGLTFYNLGMGFQEGYIFAGELMRRHRLRPRYVVINADNFFRARSTRFARRIMRRTPWEHAKRSLELNGDYFYYTNLRRWFPHFLPKARVPQGATLPKGIAVFISERTGAWQVVPPGYIKTEQRLANRRPADDVDPDTLRGAGQMIADWRGNGTGVVLTVVPFDKANYQRAQMLSERLQVPLIAPRLHDIETWDGSHLTPDRAAEFTRRFLTAFDAYRNGS